MSKDTMTKDEAVLLYRLALPGQGDPGPAWLQSYVGQPFYTVANSLRNDAPYKNALRANVDKIIAGQSIYKDALIQVKGIVDKL